MVGIRKNFYKNNSFFLFFFYYLLTLLTLLTLGVVNNRQGEPPVAKPNLRSRPLSSVWCDRRCVGLGTGAEGFPHRSEHGIWNFVWNEEWHGIRNFDSVNFLPVHAISMEMTISMEMPLLVRKLIESKFQEEQDLFVFKGTIERPRAPAVKRGRLTPAWREWGLLPSSDIQSVFFFCFTITS